MYNNWIKSIWHVAWFFLLLYPTEDHNHLLLKIESMLFLKLITQNKHWDVIWNQKNMLKNHPKITQICHDQCCCASIWISELPKGGFNSRCLETNWNWVLVMEPSWELTPGSKVSKKWNRTQVQFLSNLRTKIKLVFFFF